MWWLQGGGGWSCKNEKNPGSCPAKANSQVGKSAFVIPAGGDMNEWSVHGDVAGIFPKLFVADLAWPVHCAASN